MAASIDSDEDEDFVFYGTPLEPLKEDERRKPVQISDLTAKDKQGRVRFHGAFTGGFSAGYFNSVGTKEGWTPSEFRSSRVERADTSRSKPEDFMDEEDFDEFGIAPRKLKTSSDFVTSSESTRKQTLDSRGSGELMQDALAALIVPERTSIGIRLLRKLGWKEGQGIGPRLKRKAQKDPVRVYGCALPSDEAHAVPSMNNSSSDDDDSLHDVTFAPKDICPISFQAKDNTHGIGYSGINPSSALPTAVTHNRGVTGRRQAIRGQAFGVGALEEDDDDIYAMDELSNYDMSMDVESTDRTYGWTAPKPRHHSLTGHPDSGATYIGAVLEGFHLASKPSTLTKVFPPPVIPRDYRPVHVFKSEMQAVSQTHSSKRLDPASRGDILGETPHLNSVFELVSSSDEKRLKDATKTRTPADERTPADDVVATATSVSQQPTPTRDGQNVAGPSRIQRLAAAASPGEDKSRLKPFVNYPEKQKRYDVYNSLISQGNRDPYASLDTGHMTEWEREREQKEFERAVQLYRPLSAMMAARFTSGRFDDDPNSAEIDDSKQGELSELDKAVEMGMFGRLTRERHEWHPHKLLCKRFNVPDPYPGSTIVGLPGAKRDKISVFNFLDFADPQRLNSPKDLPKPIEDAPKKVETPPKLNIFEAYFKAQEMKKKKQKLNDEKQVDEEKEQLKEGVYKEDEKVKDEKQFGSISIAGNEQNTDAVDPNSKVMTNVDDIDDRNADDIDDRNPNDETHPGDRPPMDLFKAIFADESSESSSDDEATPVVSKSPDPTVTPVISESPDTTITPVVLKSPDLTTPHDVPGIQPPLVTFEKPSSRVPTPGGELNDSSMLEKPETFGPKLPPSFSVPLESDDQIQLTSERRVPLSSTAHYGRNESHRKRLHRRMEKIRQKKTKKKSKKHKKERRKKAKKRRRRESSGSEADSDTSTSSDTELLHRLKAAKAKVSLADLVS